MKKNLLSCLTSYVISLISLHAYAQAGEWTWMKGDSTTNSNGVFGTQGVVDSANVPQGLYEACEWKDKLGNFWIYGGLQSGSDPTSNLWKYDPLLNQWAWVKGPGNITDEVPVYGTQGIPDPANTPGARWGIASWIDSSENLWLFGGETDGSTWRNDLWKYSIADNEWTWMKGSNVANSSGIYGTQGVANTTNTPGARSETAANWVDGEYHLWLFGGQGYASNGIDGVMNDVWEYDISTNQWTWVRGATQTNDAGSYGTNGVEDTSNNPHARMIYTKWKDEDGNFWIFSGGDYTNDVYYNDVWRYNPSVNKWTWMSGTNLTNNFGVQDSFCVAGTNLVGPSRFENRCCWVDDCFNFWEFGGARSNQHDSAFNDLWHFNYQDLQWTMIHGSVSINQDGNYGIQGVANINNEPPSRSGSNAWVDDGGNLWMFGGTKIIGDYFNDMWKYVIDPACPLTISCAVTNASPFSSSDTLICEKFCISFFDSSQNNPTAWQWLFEGGTPSSSTDENPVSICYQVPGVYDVTLITTSANGNDTVTLSNFITVYPTPPFPTITQVLYTLSSSPANSYQWQFNTINIPGATNQSYTILQTGYYTVVVGDSNGCKNSTTTYVLISGVDDVSGDGNISIYPNPATDGLMVELLNVPDLVGMGDEISISILNTLGQEIFYSRQKILSIAWKKEIDLHGISSGVYFIEIKSQNIFLKKKIIITK
ncbi:MAG TPA: kelch repeat-containing protein [Chitinophagales bacterium]|nr:kelch repeat-containing protein [Chitinophagales bacterium]